MKVKYFAWVRERVGKAEETVEPPASVRTTRRRRYFERSSSGGLSACNVEFIPAGAPIG